MLAAAFLMMLIGQAHGFTSRDGTGLSGNSSQGVRARVYGIRIEHTGKQLRVTEILELLNAPDTPGRKQQEKLFWLALPEGASVLSSAVQTPEGEILPSVAMAAPGEGRCYFRLSLQRGTTKIQLQYQVPFTESATFAPHVPFPADDFGVVFSPDLQFTPAEPGSYTRDRDQDDEPAEVAHDLRAGTAAKFAVSFSGTASDDSVTSSQKEVGLRRAASGQGLRQFLCITLPGLVLILSFALYRHHRPRKNQQDVFQPVPEPRDSIREELFALEMARVQHRISKRRYAASKAALQCRLADVVRNDNERS